MRSLRALVVSRFIGSGSSGQNDVAKHHAAWMTASMRSIRTSRNRSAVRKRIAADCISSRVVDRQFVDLVVHPDGEYRWHTCQVDGDDRFHGAGACKLVWTG